MKPTTQPIVRRRRTVGNATRRRPAGGRWPRSEGVGFEEEAARLAAIRESVPQSSDRLAFQQRARRSPNSGLGAVADGEQSLDGNELKPGTKPVAGPLETPGGL